MADQDKDVSKVLEQKFIESIHKFILLLLNDEHFKENLIDYLDNEEFLINYLKEMGINETKSL